MGTGVKHKSQQAESFIAATLSVNFARKEEIKPLSRRPVVEVQLSVRQDGSLCLHLAEVAKSM